MKKVRYNGSMVTLLPTLNLEVNPGDVIDVPDDFNNVLFEEAPVTTTPDKPSTSKSSDTNKEANK